MKILVAGVGNVLRGDDGFGIAVVEEMRRANSLPEQVELFEAGIDGISLVQELMNGYDAMIVCDTIDRGAEPGTLYLIEPERPDISALDRNALHNSLVDAHYADPSKVILLAAALNILPERVFLVACQPQFTESPSEALSEPLRKATYIAANRIRGLIGDLLERPSPGENDAAKMGVLDVDT